MYVVFFFFKQKTAYEMRISDWSSDVCSSDLPTEALRAVTETGAAALRRDDIGRLTVGSRADFAVLDAPSHLHLAYRPGVPLVSEKIGRASCRERGCQYV